MTTERSPDFLVHASKDNVGVVVTEAVKSGENIVGWVMETDETISIKSLDDIPIGHKLALRDLKADDTAVKYGQDIGRITVEVCAGSHVHVHNLKTKKW